MTALSTVLLLALLGTHGAAVVLRPPCVSRHYMRAARAPMMRSDDDLWDDVYKAELRARIEESATAAQLGTPDMVLQKRDAVWVLIFNPGNKDEGVYTLQGRDNPCSYVLAFEETDEASRFASLLQAQGFDLAHPTQWHADQVRTFCEIGQFQLGVVPNGALLTPPTHNEYDAEAFDRASQKARRPERPPERRREDFELMRMRAHLENLFDL